MRDKYGKTTLTILGIGIFFMAWFILSSILNNIYFPGSLAVFERLYQMLLNGSLVSNAEISMERVLLGFSLAALVGTSLGIVIASSKRVSLITHPIIEFLRYISPISLFPLFILLFGLGLSSKVAMIFWVAWIPILIVTVQSVQNVETSLIKAARSMGIKGYSLISKVLIPAALPHMIGGLRVGMGIGFLGLVTAEMIGANSGLGFLVLQSAETFKITDMYVGILTLSLLGFSLNYILLLIEKRYTKHRSL